MADDVASSSSFKVDYAASNRSTCNRCRQPIAAKELRIGPMVQSDKGDFKYPQWHHFHCFEDGWLKKHPGALTNTNHVSGLDSLQFADQKKIKSLVVGGDSTLEIKAVDAAEKKLAMENKLIWARREKLEALSDAELRELLTHNHQPCSGKVFGGRAKMLERCADAMVFGTLPKCPSCKNGDFYFSHGEYKCTGAADEFAKCEYKTRDVSRGAFSAPADLADDHDFLSKFAKGKVKVTRQRITDTLKATGIAQQESAEDESETAGAPIASAAVANEELSDGVAGASGKRPRDVPAALDKLKPFQGAVVMFAGKLSKTQAVLEALIVNNGGAVAKTASSATICVCTPQEATGNGSKKGQDALAQGLLCVDEKWVTASIEAGHRLSSEEAAQYVLANPLKVDAARDTLAALAAKYELEKAAQEQRALLEERYTEAPKSKKAATETVKKVVVKGSGAVEPESGLVETGHIYEPQPGEVFSSVMNLTDATTGKNGFYILQLIEHDSKNKWTVFRKWGKLGDDSIGGTTQKTYPMPDPAVREFCKVFSDKTGNEWANRKAFQKIYGKFMPIEIDLDGGSSSSSSAPAAALNSAGYQGPLPKATQDFVSLIFDIKAMNDALKELEIDTQKMPLGKLSKATLQEGFRSLNELQAHLLSLPTPAADVVETSTKSAAGRSAAASAMSQEARTRVVSLTNRFYNYIPHIAPPGGLLPLLDTIEKVQEKNQLLTALQDLEIASKMLSSSGGASHEKHPIDQHYEKLNSTLTLVDRSSDVFKRINTYIQNTHGHTHTTYTLELVDLWEVERNGEAERYAMHSTNENRMLLWHGSRLTNWGGILSQGLRIAPPEAPTTGYMFGKGVYFADMSSKSANYCFTTSEKTTGVLMLCEVALGKMKEFKRAFYVDGLEEPYQSTKGVGQYWPDPAVNYHEDNGCVIPLGPGTATGVKDTTLLYNEFIVYDVSQIRTRYVMRVQFHYKVKAGTFH